MLSILKPGYIENRMERKRNKNPKANDETIFFYPV